jgi:hypothetical protein
MNVRPLVLITSAVLLGCRAEPRKSRTVDAFLSFQPGMPMQELTNRVGAPDRHAGSGVFRWEYDLADGSKVMVYPATGLPRGGLYNPYELQEFSSPLARIRQVRGTNVLWDKMDEKYYLPR